MSSTEPSFTDSHCRIRRHGPPLPIAPESTLPAMAGSHQRLGRRSQSARNARRRDRPEEIGLDALAIRNRRISRQLDKRSVPVKYIKILALTAIAAAAFMAFLGAGTASGTRLCTDSGGVCTGQSGNITGTAHNAPFATDLANVECSGSATTINASSSTGAPILGEVTALSFTGCRTQVTLIPCTVTVRNLPYSASLEGKTLTVTDPVGAGAKVVCGTVLSCEFLTTKAELAITNGEPTVAVAKVVGLSHESGTICPSTATWSATYAVTSPTGLTVL